MTEHGAAPAEDESGWPENYFNYFTEAEHHFQVARGTSLFLLSPLDWALLENWKSAGIPLEAVLRGIDEAFEKWRARKQKTRQVNSLAYCSQNVMKAAKELANTSQTRDTPLSDLPFDQAEIIAYLERTAAQIEGTGSPQLYEVVRTLRELGSFVPGKAKDLEAFERQLTALEEKMIAIARAATADGVLLDLRKSLDDELSLYRGKMTADQISMLERRYLDTRILEKHNLPRISLFYMGM
jgi:hypothetical protein